MLIIFKSKSSAEIVMYQSHVHELFTYLGKELERGVITHQEIEAILLKIDLFISEKKQLEKNEEIDEDELDEFELKLKKQEVTLSARFYPLIEMLKLAKNKKNDILWGV